MLPADDDQRRREMAAAVPQPPVPSTPPSSKPTKTRKLNHPINLLSVDLIFDNEDLLKEILLRLPVKSVIRFKSVCRKWLSLISSDYFCHQHTLRRPQKPQPSLILEHLSRWPIRNYFYRRPASINGGEKVMIPYTLPKFINDAQKVMIPFPLPTSNNDGETVMTPYTLPELINDSWSLTHFIHHDYRILQACNGLWLLNTRSDIYLVYNPTTRLSRNITPTFLDEDHFVQSMALAFDPSKSPYYKVVCVITGTDVDNNFGVEVYESESHSWKLSLGPFTFPSYLEYSNNPIYCNNAIYWLCNMYGDAFYCFDFAKHEMKELPLPESDAFMRSYLQELDGRLYYVILDYDDSESHQLLAEVWELGGDGNSEWLLKHLDVLFTYECIDDHKQPHYIFSCEGIGNCVKLMQGQTDGSLQLIYNCHYHVSGNMKTRAWKMKMRAYNFLDKSLEDLVDFTVPPFNDTTDYVEHPMTLAQVHDDFLKAFQFWETLALV